MRTLGEECAGVGGDDSALTCGGQLGSVDSGHERRDGALGEARATVGTTEDDYRVVEVEVVDLLRVVHIYSIRKTTRNVKLIGLIRLRNGNDQQRQLSLLKTRAHMRTRAYSISFGRCQR